MINKLGVQLYTIRDYMKDPEFADVAFKKLAELGYTEAHTAAVALEDKLFCELLAKHGISIIGTHYSYRKILNDFEDTVAVHKMWNTTNIGIGGMPSEAKASLDGLRSFIKEFNKAAEEYAKEGFRLTYHNHNFEFLRIDGKKTLMDILYEELDPVNTSFVLDTCWVAAGAGDVCDWMEKLKGRIDILHLKDVYMIKENGYFSARMTEVGNGVLAWDKIIKTAEDIGVKHYVVEQDNFFTDSPFNSLKISADFLEKYKK